MIGYRVGRRMIACKGHYVYCAFLLPLLRLSEGEEVNLKGSSFIVYNMFKTQRSIFGVSETLSLRFKTIHPSGLLLYAYGTSGQFINLELFHCKLRYSISFRGSSKGPYSVTFGDKLCDNIWHTVRIMRHKRKLYLFIDKDKQVVDVNLPGYQQRYQLLLNVKYYVGGRSTNRYGEVVAENFVGCVGDVMVDTFYPISDVKNGNKTGYKITGNITFDCPPSNYIPLTFTNNKAFLIIPTVDKHKVSVSFAFRTYDRDGILMHRDGNTASVFLYLQDATLNFEFQIGSKNPIVLGTAVFVRKDLNDGAWHTVKASVDPFFMSFEIDDYGGVNTSQHAVELYGSTTLDFENVTYVGGGTYRRGMLGFVGCMQNLKANGRKIDLKYLAKPPGIFSQFVEKGQCSVRSFCHPSPCRHRSQCVQKLSNFTCVCQRFFNGRYCEIPLFQATCQRYKELGMTKDAYCTVDPDNVGPLPEFRVFCNMSAGKDAITVINHKLGNGSIRVRDASRYSSSLKIWIHLINYGVSLPNLRALVDESDSCRQYVQFDCVDTTFLAKQPDGRSGTVWFSTDLVQRYYWGGARAKSATCACAGTGSCYDRTKVCNCDTGDSIWRQDAGYITEKNDLPVVGIYFPRSAKSSNFTLGPLECFGRKKQLTRDTNKRKFVGIACQPLVTTPPPIYLWRRGKLKTTMKPSGTTSSFDTTSSFASSTERFSKPTSNFNSEEKRVPDTRTSVNDSGNYVSKNFSQLNISMSSNDTNFMPVDPTRRVRVEKADVGKEKGKDISWFVVLIIAGSAVLFVLALFILLVVVRHKRANGVWCTGLSIFPWCVKQQQLPKIEIYRHSMGNDSPDILHMEDFKNTKVVDLQLHRGRYVHKKNIPKKTVKFKDGF